MPGLYYQEKINMQLQDGREVSADIEGDEAGINSILLTDTITGETITVTNEIKALALRALTAAWETIGPDE